MSLASARTMLPHISRSSPYALRTSQRNSIKGAATGPQSHPILSHPTTTTVSSPSTTTPETTTVDLSTSSTMAESYHWRMQLNNYLQANGGARLLTWELFQSGPLHQPSWTAIAYIRGVEYGRAYGPSQSSVKEEAARQTLAALISDRRARGYA